MDEQPGVGRRVRPRLRAARASTTPRSAARWPPTAGRRRRRATAAPAPPPRRGRVPPARGAAPVRPRRRPSGTCRPPRAGRSGPAPRRPRRCRAPSPWSAPSSCRPAAARRRRAAPTPPATPASCAASSGHTRSRSHDSSGRSSASPRNSVWHRCTWVWMKPGRTSAPPTSMTRSWRHAGSTAPTAAIRPSRIDRSPSTTARASFMVRIVALVSFRDAMAAAERTRRRRRRLSGRPWSARTSASSLSDAEATAGSAARPRRTAISSARMLTAISCGVTAPRSRPIGAWMPREALRVDALADQHVVDARHLGAAADEADVAQVAGDHRAQRVEVVAVAAGDDHRRSDEAGSVGAASHAGTSSTTTSVAVGKRSRLAKASRSSTTCTRKPASCANRAR